MEFKFKIIKFFSIALILPFNIAFGATPIQHTSNQPSKVLFKENKGQIHDQNYSPRPDVYYSGKNGNLIYHLKNNGISYQINRVDEWKELEAITFKCNQASDKEKNKYSSRSTIYRSINKKGELEIITPLGTIIEKAPVAYHNKKIIASKWLLNNKNVSFELAKFDTRYPITSDPAVRLWGIFYGGVGIEYDYGSATYPLGNVFMGGFTQTTPSAIMPTSGAHQAGKSTCGSAATQTVQIAEPTSLSITDSTNSGTKHYTCKLDPEALSNSSTTRPTINTTYSVIRADWNQCATSTSLTQNISICTDIKKIEPNEALFIIIYPNPNNDEFILISNSTINLAIVNVLGQSLKSFSLNKFIENQVVISNLANGIYFIFGQYNNQAIKQKIIVTI